MRRSILTPFRMGYTFRISYPKVHLNLAKYEEVHDYSYSTLFIFEDLVNVVVFACFVYITKNKRLYETRRILEHKMRHYDQ